MQTTISGSRRIEHNKLWQLPEGERIPVIDKPDFRIPKDVCIPAHTCRLVKAKYRRGKIQNEYTVDSEKIIDRAAGLYIRPAVYTRDSSRVLCIDNYSHYDYVIPKNTHLGHIIDVDIASKPITGLKPETIRVLDYGTP